MSDKNNPFGDLAVNDMEEGKDTLGGGSRILETEVYDATIKLVYAGESSGGAKSVTVHLDIDGTEYKETVYVTSGKEKGQKPFYEKDGKKIPLPGFTTANDLALLSTGKDLGSQDFEAKVVKLYDFESRAEVPTNVMVATSLLGLQVKVGILKIEKNKQVKEGNAYVDTNDKVERNEINKIFHAETGKTVSEFTAKAESAEFLPKWKEKNSGKTVNKFKAVGSAGTPGQSGGSSAGSAGGSSKSLFT